MPELHVHEQVENTCHACGKDYKIPGRGAENDIYSRFELCPKCRTSKRIISIVVDGDDEFILYSAGIRHAVERLSEQVYWDYQEFSADEWEAMEKLSPYGCSNMNISELLDGIQDLESMPLDVFRRHVAAFVADLQEFWEAGVKAGILTVNQQPDPKGPKFREWPIKFKVDVYEESLAELIENGVVNSPRKRKPRKV